MPNEDVVDVPPRRRAIKEGDAAVSAPGAFRAQARDANLNAKRQCKWNTCSRPVKSAILPVLTNYAPVTILTSCEYGFRGCPTNISPPDLPGTPPGAGPVCLLVVPFFCRW